MSDNQAPKGPIDWQGAFSVTPIAVGLQVGCLTLLIVIGSIAGGLLLDNLFGTKPVLTILFVLGSAPLALFLTFWLAMRQIKKAYPSGSTSGGKSQPRNEEDDRE